MVYPKPAFPNGAEFSEECHTSPEDKAEYDNVKELLKLKRENEELRKENLFLK